MERPEIGEHPRGEGALAAFSAALGEPMHARSPERDTYRWHIARHRHVSLNLLLSITTRGGRTHALLVISDPCCGARESVRLLTLITRADIHSALEDIRGRLVCD